MGQSQFRFLLFTTEKTFKTYSCSKILSQQISLYCNNLIINRLTLKTLIEDISFFSRICHPICTQYKFIEHFRLFDDLWHKSEHHFCQAPKLYKPFAFTIYKLFDFTLWRNGIVRVYLSSLSLFEPVCGINRQRTKKLVEELIFISFFFHFFKVKVTGSPDGLSGRIS